MICEYCEEQHDGEYGSGRFCNAKCARGFSTHAKRDIINKQVSEKLTHPLTEYICPKCEIEFSSDRKDRKYCSMLCRNTNEEGIAARTKGIKQSFINGREVTGGFTQWYPYKGFKVQGTYELRACKIFDEWKEKGWISNWEYTNDRVQYIGEDGEQHSYLIDFKIWHTEDEFYYLETKGFITNKDLLKWQAVRDNGFILIHWLKEDITKAEKELINSGL